MTKTFLAALLFCAYSAKAFIPPKAFQSSYIEAEEEILRLSLGHKSKNAVSALRQDLLEVIFKDKQNRVNDNFDIPDYFLASAKFWFSIYTQYTSQQVVIHDKRNLELVYNVMDFTPLHESEINRFAKSKLQADLSLEKAIALKNTLKKLHRPEGQLSLEDKSVLKAVKNAGIAIPASAKAKKKLFKRLATNLRTQTGQRDMVFRGVLRSLPYLPFLEKQFENFDLPKELLAIAFVESSFNLKAVSYAGAAGIWQFMPLTASYFMPKRTKNIDYRANPIIATLGAMHLLKQNKMILKRWDLAIPAYNFGTSHLVKARRKYKEKASLAYILQNYEHNDVGFASKNYYAEFLAMARALAYKDAIFPLAGHGTDARGINQDNISVYVTKCRLRPKTYFNLLKKNSPKIQKLNAHFIKTRPIYSPRKLVVSDRTLTSRKYRRVSQEELTEHYPKNFWKLARHSKCGER